MTSQQILAAYFDHYRKTGHIEIPNMSLVPENDPSLLFVNSGMFPLVPYLAGEKHPLGTRLMSVQRAGRFDVDLDEVGDNRHTTMFHMIGNWSLGDYFKKEQLQWIYSFLIERLKLDPNRLYSTVFEGDQYAPRDTESIELLKNIFRQYRVSAQEGIRIFPCGRGDNWWQRGDAPGELGGPDSEIFYYLGDGTGEGKHPAQFQDEFIEIGNNVFMQYRKNEAGGWDTLPQKNIDFGGGLERIALVSQGKRDIFETDNFWPIIETIQKISGKNYYENEKTKRSMRIVADHIRGATLMAMDGVIPSNKDQGYFLRRIIRRIVRTGKALEILNGISVNLVPTVVKLLTWLYPQLVEKQKEIQNTFAEEERRFSTTLERAAGEVARTIEKLSNASLVDIAVAAFKLYQSSGYPPEQFFDELKEKKPEIDFVEVQHLYDLEFHKHQKISREGASEKFKGGLADHSDEVLKYHTATHLLHQALRMVLGESVHQYGSNITKDRLRFDFTCPEKLSETQIASIEEIVNKAIEKKLPVHFVMLPKIDAEKSGALHFFKEKYPDTVKIYFIGESLENAFSKEFCGGPHVEDLSQLSPTFAIYKQESVAKGIRRIYARFN